jgi:hypothetical protein
MHDVCLDAQYNGYFPSMRLIVVSPQRYTVLRVRHGPESSQRRVMSMEPRLDGSRLLVVEVFRRVGSRSLFVNLEVDCGGYGLSLVQI